MKNRVLECFWMSDSRPWHPRNANQEPQAPKDHRKSYYPEDGSQSTDSSPSPTGATIRYVGLGYLTTRISGLSLCAGPKTMRNEAHVH